ncbi:phospholipase B-like protein B, partial [Salpingoeca rosetta]
MSARLLVVLVAVAGVVGSVSAATPFIGHRGSVTLDAQGKAKYHDDVLDLNAAAFGSFDAAKNHKSGFGVLQIESNSEETGDRQYYAAGFLEGYLTHSEIYNHHINVLAVFSDLANGPSPELKSYINNQTQWIKKQLANNPSDRYWRQVGMILQQYDGLMDGYNAAAPADKQLESFAFFILNGCGDLFDLLPKYQTKQFPNFDNMTKPEFDLYRSQTGHCSALVKLTGDFSQLFMAHSSWFRYQVTNRIYKHYNLKADVSAAQKISFSSYPGFLESLDDFYLMDSGLVMLQTTNNVFNKDLQKYIHPETLLAWVRVRAATALARDGEEWFDVVKRYNSGSYNNQYMVVDLNKFTPGQPLPDGTLWVGEQIPGLVEYADMTGQLAKGYWPSYNVPYFEK